MTGAAVQCWNPLYCCSFWERSLALPGMGSGRKPGPTVGRQRPPGRGSDEEGSRPGGQELMPAPSRGCRRSASVRVHVSLAAAWSSGHGWPSFPGISLLPWRGDIPIRASGLCKACSLLHATEQALCFPSTCRRPVAELRTAPGLCISWLWERRPGRAAGVCAGVGHGQVSCNGAGRKCFRSSCREELREPWGAAGSHARHAGLHMEPHGGTGTVPQGCRWGTHCLKRRLPQLRPTTVPRARSGAAPCTGFVHTPEFPQFGVLQETNPQGRPYPAGPSPVSPLPALLS